MRILLDDAWKFQAGDDNRPPESCAHALKAGFARGYAAVDLKDDGWRSVSLPHDWAIEANPVPWGMLDQGSYQRGIGWYRKSFDLPADILDKQVYLEFEGISRQATVWVNGFELGTHPSGYTPFLCDITAAVPRYLDAPSLPPGAQPSVVAVRVDATHPEGWWYEGCGIYRHVWLHIVDPLHVAPYSAWCSTPKVTEAQARVRFAAEIRNAHDADQPCEVRVRILDANDCLVAKGVTPVIVARGAALPVAVEMTLDQPHLWSPEHPYLYRIHVDVVSREIVADHSELPLGVRWCEFHAESGFSLNGKAYKLQGVCCHQDFAGVGVALPDRLHEKRVELLKEMGCNALRCSHHPPAPALLEACDRLGLLVLNENRKMDFSPEGLRDLRLLVRRDRHHPCVFAWCLVNEEFAGTRPLSGRALKVLHRIAKEEDPTRATVVAGNLFLDVSSSTTEAFWREVDIVGRNYSPDAYARDHAVHPKQITMATEFASTPTTRGTYTAEVGYPLLVNIDEPWPSPLPAGPKPGFEVSWQEIARHRFMAGGFLWTGMDYRGEPTPWRWPYIISQYGAIFDLCGFPKDGYHYFKSCWKPEEPQVYVFPHWTWPGREGRQVYLRAYSNCDEVELFVNAVSHGRQAMPPLGHLEWPVVYQPGAVVAVGYRKGREVARHAQRTAGPAARLQLSVDRDGLVAGHQDVACVTVAVTDAAGVVVPDARNLLTFHIQGAGRLLGTGNGDPLDHTLDASPVRRTFQGYALGIVQGSDTPGNIIVKVVADGLAHGEISIALRKGVLLC